MTTPNDDSLRDGIGFPEAMQQLELIVDKLEGQEDLGLEEALALFERGTALAHHAQRLLSDATLRVTQLEFESDVVDLGGGFGIEQA